MMGINLIDAFTLLLLFVMAIWVMRDLIHLRKTISWLSDSGMVSEMKNINKFVICIPAYNEQDTIADTIRYFTGLNYSKELYKIVIVTTAKEIADVTKNTHNTYAVAKQAIRAINADDATIEVVHYPDLNGVMAHQINYVAKLFTKKLSEDNTYFVVYNADSRPGLNILKAANHSVEDFKKINYMTPKILQQSSLFTTQSRNGHVINSAISDGAAIHQSLWTLRHELNYYLIQSKNALKLTASSNFLDLIHYSRNAHCVGHGLYVYGAYYLQNPLPDNLLNEDLPYGLLQSSLRQPIIPIKSLEISLSPNKLIEVYRQKSVWFNPFFEFFGYSKTIIKNKLYHNKTEVYLLTFQAYFSLVVWALHSIIWLGGFILATRMGLYTLTFWLILLFFYWYLPAIIYKRFLAKTDLNLDIRYSSILLGVIYVLSHSVGPIWGVSRWAKALITGLKPSKPKTSNI